MHQRPKQTELIRNPALADLHLNASNLKEIKEGKIKKQEQEQTSPQPSEEIESQQKHETDNSSW
jgi:hypothetical protein